LNSTLLFGAIADDDTGASDIAGMLADQGVRTILAVDCPTPQWLESHCGESEAIVIGTATRAAQSAYAAEVTHRASCLLVQAGVRQLQVKYCSTFDSTPEGNIGPSISAALAATGEPFTIAVPALPVNGRTTYLGHHFVHGDLLENSPMRDHPLNPMTDSNLVRWLSRQFAGPVGLAAYSSVSAGPAELGSCFRSLKSNGCRTAVVDCTSQADVSVIAEASLNMRVISGSSALAMEYPRLWRNRGWLSSGSKEPPPVTAGNRGAACLILAGSCSEATRLQNRYAAANGVQLIQASPLQVGASDVQGLAEEALSHLARGRHCLVSTSAAPDQVRQTQLAMDLCPAETGLRISQGLAALALEIRYRIPLAGLILAGGESSSVICRALAFGAFRVGRSIVPGVPLCLALDGSHLPVVLKSGNFGGEGFYLQAIDACMLPRPYWR
jgi:uncharacterized protein YgbK (DUF1537 family)